MSEPILHIAFTLNDRSVAAEVPAAFTLLRMIRETFRLTGTKWSCEKGECGVCTVLVDGRPIPSCLMLAAQVEGKTVETVEGLAETPLGRAVVEAFADAGAVQCGFCTPGMVVAACAILRETPDPTDEAIRAGLSGVLCRCTGYQKLFDGVRLAARRARTHERGRS